MTAELDFEQMMRFWRTPTGVTRDYVEGRFGQVHIRIVRPQNPGTVPLICFHLSPDSGRVYALWLAEMGKDRVAIAPDTPGFGDSDAPPSPPEIADYAAAMGDLCDRLGLEQVDIMGYHTGSLTAVEFAQQRPELVRRVVMVSAPIFTPEELKPFLERMGTATTDIPEIDGSHLTRRFANHKRWREKGVPAIYTHRQVAEILKGGDTSWWGHRAAFRYPLIDELPRVKQPLLVLNPEDDLWFLTQKAAPLIQNGRIHPLPGYAHGMLDVHTQEVAAVVRGFLDTPAPDVGKTTKKAVPPAPAKPRRAIRRAFMEGPYGQLHYRIVEPANPTRVPLVCFHLSPHSGRLYESILTRVGRDRIAIAPDTPGFGESAFPPDALTIEDFARTMAHLIDTLGLKQVDVMGYHTGSLTVLELALQRPDLVRRIVQISSPVWSAEELSVLKAKRRVWELRDDGTHLSERWLEMQRYSTPDVPIEVRTKLMCESMRGGPATPWGHRAAHGYDVIGRLPQVKQPILIVSPDDDLAHMSPRGLPLMQDGRMVEITHWSHGFIDTMPDEFDRILRDFLDAPSVAATKGTAVLRSPKPR